MSQLEARELFVNTFVAVKVASDLNKATNLTANLHGADVLITQQLLSRLIRYELGLTGLNLTHSQDKDYIQNLVSAANVILDVKYADHWRRLAELINEYPVDLLNDIENYLSILTKSQGDTYTSPFEIVTSNLGQ